MKSLKFWFGPGCGSGFRELTYFHQNLVQKHHYPVAKIFLDHLEFSFSDY